MRVTAIIVCKPNDLGPVIPLNGLLGETHAPPSVTGIQTIHDNLKIMMWMLVGVSTCAGILSSEFQSLLKFLLCFLASLIVLHASISLLLMLCSNRVCWR